MEPTSVADPSDPVPLLLERIESVLEREGSAAALRLLDDVRGSAPSAEELPLVAATLLMDAEPARAARLALEALSLRPFHPAATNLLGLACLEAGETALGRRVLERASAMAPALIPARDDARTADARTEPEPIAVSAELLQRWAGELPRREIRELLQARPPTLGACILVRDGQEAALARCLGSLEIARHIVLVDLRAGGRELALEPDARVTRVARPAAANEGLRQLRSDWILVLDAAETLAAGAEAALRHAMDEERTLGHTLVVQECAGGASRLELRLARNAPGLRFAGSWGESLLPSLLTLEERWGLVLAEAQATILRERLADPALEPPSRLAELLPQSAGHELRQARLARGRLLYAAGQVEQALAEARAACAAPERGTNRLRTIEIEEPITLAGRCLLRLGRFDELGYLMARYHAEQAPTAGTLFLEGVAARERKDTGRATALLRQALDSAGRPGYATPLPEVCGCTLPNLLGTLLLDRRELPAARRCFEISLARNPHNVEASLGLLAIRFGEGGLQETLVELDRLAQHHGDDVEIWLAGETVLSRLPRLGSEALGWLEEARNRFPQNSEIQRRLGEAQLRCGGAEAALRTWAGLEPAEPWKLTAAQVAATLACGRELPSIAEESRSVVRKEVLAWFERWMAFQAFAALDRALLDLPRAERALPGLVASTGDWLERIGQHDAAERLRKESAAEV